MVLAEGLRIYQVMGMRYIEIINPPNYLYIGRGLLIP